MGSLHAKRVYFDKIILASRGDNGRQTEWTERMVRTFLRNPNQECFSSLLVRPVGDTEDVHQVESMGLLKICMLKMLVLSNQVTVMKIGLWGRRADWALEDHGFLTY